MMVSSVLMGGREKETLADFVSRVRNEAGLTLHDVANRSGGRISNAYVSRIENGYVRSPSPRMLTALAKGLGVGEDEIFALVRGSAEPEGFREGKLWELHEEIKKVDKKEHKQLIDTLLDGVIRMVRSLPKKTNDPRQSDGIRRTK